MKLSLASPGAARAPSPTCTRPLRVLAISAKSGGGHDGTAQALRNLLERAYEGDIRWQCLDVYEGRLRMLPWLARVRQHATVLWSAFLALSDRRWFIALARWVLKDRCTRSVLARTIDTPDLVIATHFVAAQILDSVASGFPVRPATVIVATDYRPHRAWFSPADMLIVSREPGLALARACLGSSQRILASTLLPCMPAAARRAGREVTARRRIIAVMGADGTSGSKLIRLLHAIGRQTWASRLEIEVVCGHNARLRERVIQHALRDAPEPGAPQRAGLRVVALGYVNNLPERIAAADICLLRASPLVMTEAVAAATPVIAFDWHAHERANASLLEHWGCGRMSRSIPQLVRILQEWTLNEASLACAREAARNIASQTLGVREMRGLLQQVFDGRGAP
ncbi:MAG: hypothetical protein RI884_2594 [Pseudomonadota bacterium]